MVQYVDQLVLDQRQDDAVEICRTLRDVVDSEKLQLEFSEHGETLGCEGITEYHVRVTVIATGEMFFLRFAYEGDPMTHYDFRVNPAWFQGTIRWIPLGLSVEVRDSFRAEFERWADAQWRRSRQQRMPRVVPRRHIEAA